MAKSSSYRVAKGRSILTMDKDRKNEIFLREGQILDPDLFTKAELERHVANGFAVAGSMTEPVENWLLGTVGKELNPPKESPIIVSKPPKNGSKAPVQTKVSAPEPKKPANPQVQTKESPWMFDPASLEGKPLESLLAMIHDIDPEWASGIEKAEEAIEILSQDFKG